MQNLIIFFVTVWVFIAGTSSQFSRNNLKRGIQCFCFGLLLTLVTYLVIPSQLILFGILHCLGSCMIIYALLSKILKKINPMIGLLSFLLLFLATINIQNGTVLWFSLPKSLYTTSFLFPLGFPSNTLFSADYFPIIPWIFAFIAGSFFGEFVVHNQLPTFIYKSHSKPIAFIGRYTIYIYLLHQPIIYGACYIFFEIIAKQFQ